MASYELKLPTRLAVARTGAVDQAYLSQGLCINWLLDCRSVCALPSARAVIDNALAEIGHLGVISGPYFRSVLDQIETALAVEAAFTSLELNVA